VVVEDDTVTRLALAAAIEAEPALRLAAVLDRVGPALTWLQERRADLLLTDLGLPDGSGLDIIRACFSIRPDCAIMVITMSSDEDNILASIEAGASGYVLKDSCPLDIAHALLELHAGGSPISPLIARKVLRRMRVPAAAVSARTRAKGRPAVWFTPREACIMELIARGDSYARIASSLSVQLGTVQSHVKSIYGKLSVHSRGAAVFEAQQLGLLRMCALKARQ
jgi:DNA-binding NarL/FixJ family response regulator